jgi:hypothetical protein
VSFAVETPLETKNLQTVVNSGFVSAEGTAKIGWKDSSKSSSRFQVIPVESKNVFFSSIVTGGSKELFTKGLSLAILLAFSYCIKIDTVAESKTAINISDVITTADIAFDIRAITISLDRSLHAIINGRIF